MRGRLTSVIALALALSFAACSTEPGPTSGPRIDLAVSPPTVFHTVDFEVGDVYTFGSTGVAPEIPRPVRITGVEVIHSEGIEIVGIGAVEPGPDGIGLVPGWPPQGLAFAQAPDLFAVEWSGPVNTLFGVRTTAPISGLRGVEVRWVDANGVAGARMFDIAVYTCAPGACDVEADDADPVLRELGLLR